jgi:hypothetical protein
MSNPKAKTIFASDATGKVRNRLMVLEAAAIPMRKQRQPKFVCIVHLKNEAE